MKVFHVVRKTKLLQYKGKMDMTNTDNAKIKNGATVPTVTALYREKKRRVWELDFLRGLAVIAMCFDHLMCDFAYLSGWFSNFYIVNNPTIMKIVEFAKLYWDSSFRTCAHYIFVFIFLFLVGTSCSFSRDNARRGSGLAIFSIAFTGVTFLLKNMGVLNYGIVFGILHCIALSILVCASVDELTKFDKYVNMFLPLTLGIMIVEYAITQEFWNVQWDYALDKSHIIDYIIGYRGFGDDWFGLFPYVGIVLMGMYWGKAVYSTRQSLLPKLDGKWNKPFRFVGRHALIFYVLHQAILSGAVMLVCMALGYKM